VLASELTGVRVAFVAANDEIEEAEFVQPWSTAEPAPPGLDLSHTLLEQFRERSWRSLPCSA
jgi:hypothetical protein